MDLSWDAWVRKVTLLRLDAIAYGVLVAVLMLQTAWLDLHRRSLCVAGIAVLLATLAWWIFGIGGFALHGLFDRTFLMNGFLLGTGLMLPCVLRLACPFRWIKRGIAWLSDISYVVYLIHLSFLLWFIHLTDRDHATLYATLPLALLLTCGLAALSRALIERPILAKRPRSP